jgi:hypothetical protein
MSRRMTLCAVFCLALAGCGGDDGEEVPKPEQKLSDYAAQLAGALNEQDCDELRRLRFEITCPPTPDVLPAFQDVKITGTAEYGSGGVADLTSREAPDGGTWSLAIDEKGRWQVFRGDVTTERTVGTEITDQGPYEEALDSFLAALKEKDCAAFFRHSITVSPTRQQACAQELPLYAGLSKSLNADTDARPFFIGGNERYAFFGLHTDRPEREYRTAIVVKTEAGAPEPYQVLVTLRGPAS